LGNEKSRLLGGENSSGNVSKSDLKLDDRYSISVIIPVINEEENLSKLIPLLLSYGHGSLLDIWVVDGGSTDGSFKTAENLGAKVLKSEIPSRAKQMNLGAKDAKGDILFFVHADTLPPKSFALDLNKAMKKGYLAGCYQYQFDSDKWLLKLNSWATRFHGLFTGGGDQTLFIEKGLFYELGGFDPKYCLMEDFDLVKRIRAKTRFYLIPKSILVSARKYDQNSWLKVQLVNLYVFIRFHLGTEPILLRKIYGQYLK